MRKKILLLCLLPLMLTGCGKDEAKVSNKNSAVFEMTMGEKDYVTIWNGDSSYKSWDSIYSGKNSSSAKTVVKELKDYSDYFTLEIWQMAEGQFKQKSEVLYYARPTFSYSVEHYEPIQTTTVQI